MRRHLFGLVVLLACVFLEVSSRRREDEIESTVNIGDDVAEDMTTEPEHVSQREIKTLEDQIKATYAAPDEDNTRDILEKIKSINDGLKRPQKQKINHNTHSYIGGGYFLDKAILEKLQQIIANGKLSEQERKQDTNSLARQDNSRAMAYIPSPLYSNALTASQPSPTAVPLPYITNVPVMIMPNANGIYRGYPMSNNINGLGSEQQYATRQRPSLPFQIPWPFAPFFPILLKDPLLHYLGGGNWENLVDIGQSADVCNRKQKSATDYEDLGLEDEINDIEENNNIIPNSRQGRKINKRTIAKSSPVQKLDSYDDVTKLFTRRPQTTQKPVRKETAIDTKTVDPNDGDLRFPFGDFTWFGNRRPVAPSPGFFINRLKVRRGGVAIAGPGGVATAGKGGTAVVGPGGLAYTQPGGLAVAGPAARVVALSPQADLNSIITRLQQLSAKDSDGAIPRISRFLEAVPEGKVVATGPTVYYHPDKSDEP